MSRWRTTALSSEFRCGPRDPALKLAEAWRHGPKATLESWPKIGGTIRETSDKMWPKLAKKKTFSKCLLFLKKIPFVQPHSQLFIRQLFCIHAANEHKPESCNERVGRNVSSLSHRAPNLDTGRSRRPATPTSWQFNAPSRVAIRKGTYIKEARTDTIYTILPHQ